MRHEFYPSSLITYPSSLPPVLVEQPGVLACLSRRTTTRGVVPGVQIPSRALAMIAARYANRQSGATTLRVVPEPARKAMQVQLLPGALNMARSSIGCTF